VHIGTTNSRTIFLDAAEPTDAELQSRGTSTTATRRKGNDNQDDWPIFLAPRCIALESHDRHSGIAGGLDGCRR
jgi:hypothetical protein